MFSKKDESLVLSLLIAKILSSFKIYKVVNLSRASHFATYANSFSQRLEAIYL
jgi:hypothetical protein